MTVPEGSHSTHNGAEEQEVEREAPPCVSTYHTDPKLTEESKRNAQAKAEAESGDEG